jgi:hypothetical protein
MNFSFTPPANLIKYGVNSSLYLTSWGCALEVVATHSPYLYIFGEFSSWNRGRRNFQR